MKTRNQQIEPIAHLVPEIKGLLHDVQWDFLKELLSDISPLDLADSWHQFSKDERKNLFKLLDPKAALVLFESLSLEDQTFLVKSLEESRVATVLENLPSPDVAKIFHKLPKKAVQKMVSLVKKEEAVERIRKVMTYERGTGGALMRPEFIKLGPRMTAHNALTLIQSVCRAGERDLLRALFVVSLQGELMGSVQLEDLMTAPPDSLIQDIMTSVEPIKVAPQMDQERIAAIFTKYNLLSAPVVDETGRCLGMIPVENIIDVINAEASEDIAKMAGTKADEFRERSVFRIAWFRAPWLLATLLTQVGVSLVMRYFQFVLQEILALASFLPLVAAMGGNVGSQSAMIFVRGLALGRLKGRSKYLAVLREAAIGLLLGTGYGGLVAGFAALIYGNQFGVGFFLVVGLSVGVAMVWAAVSGALGPILFERIGIDPATAVGPMVTTLTDLFSITAYFCLAVLILLGGFF